MMTSRARTIGLLLGLLLAVPCVSALAQDQPANPPPQPDSSAGNSGGAQPQGEEEVPALPRTPQNDRVPVSGVEDYRLDGINLGRSFVVGQAEFNEVYSTNTNGAATSSGAMHDSISNLQGMLSLQLLSRRSALNLDYRPGLLVYDRGTVGTEIIQQFNITEKFYLRRWTLVLGNDFSYLPQSPIGLGGFVGGGAANSGIPGVGGGLTNFNPFFVPGQSIQTLGNRISNAFVGQAQYTFGPRSSVNFSGTYGLVHFFDTGLLNSRDLALRLGYDYTISAKQTFTVAYSRNQIFFSPGIPGFSSDSVLVGYRRTISGRMSLIVESGPQFSHFQGGVSGSSTRVAYHVRGVLRYRTLRNTIELSYQHRLSEGSGVLVGAQTDLVSASIARIVSRNWTATTSANFNHNSSLNQTTGAVTNFHFNSWNGNISASRRLGQSTNIQFQYNVSRQTSNVSGCINNIPCGSVSLNQQIGLGLVWNSRPYSID